MYHYQTTVILAFSIVLVAIAAACSGESLSELVESDWIEQDRRFSASPARGTQPSRHGVTTAQDASGGCDGIKNGRWGFHVASNENNPWWQVDLQKKFELFRIVVFNRTDRGTAGRTANLRVLVANKPGRFVQVYQHDGTVFHGVREGKPLVIRFDDTPTTARIVRLQVPGRCSLALDEIEIYARSEPQRNIALNKPADQKSVGPYSYPGTLPEGRDTAPPPVFAERFRTSHTRSAVERGRQLVRRFWGPRVEKFSAELDRLDADLLELEGRSEVPLETRRQLYLETRGIIRGIASSNPQFDFDRILFLKRHDSAGVFHMCDQYYGCNAVPGGGLFVLEHPFDPEPKLRNVLESSVVENGRLKGRTLSDGTFLSPELSYDGRTVLFAYTQATAYEKYQGKEAYEWGPDTSYHIFKVNIDGTDLVQLTDGPWDDFDPCFLPDGRIAFVSTRRGGYLRCGRHCPTYTLHSMNPDGTDIRKLSYHETHEWHPSVDNAGMIVYTRWDYVDRDTNIAHHIWTTYPDGRDPRSFHGNYPLRRESRPWMEMSIRAIPDSHKYVATAAAHHGHAFGSLVLIDQHKEDDGAMAQVTRLTPDVPFPEAEKHLKPIKDCMVYGTPWPLSEDDYLCVYGADAKNRGIYWIDRFGNRELLYRDPSISCLSPIPVRSRVRPPVIPNRTALAADIEPGNETITVVNVYDSDFRWPAETRVAALRIVQLLPKTTPPPNRPRIGVANQTNARAVLGTVPVERDGSAYFEAPAGKAIYFQAVDEQGMAIQSMRSVTYVHPGERMTCQGCHEPKRRTSAPSSETLLALQRPASQIKPDVDGSNPFNYVRLVQPAIDRNCVSCHQERKALDLRGIVEGPNNWTRSYKNLAGAFGFYFHVSNGSINQGVHGGSRTVAGQFGARAAPLLKYLDASHYGVSLSDEDLHRFVLWLDCNSEFFGSYEHTATQAKGKVVLPTLD